LWRIVNYQFTLSALSNDSAHFDIVGQTYMKTSSRILLSAIWLLAVPTILPAALTIEFDYSFDTTDFFSGPNVGRRAVLEAAADVFESRLTSENFGAISSSGDNTWALFFPNPSTGQGEILVDQDIPANTIRIYPGARDIGASHLAEVEYLYTFDGDEAWVNLFTMRDSTTNFDSFGGPIAFDSTAAWYFDDDPTTLEAFPGQFDLFTMAQHEIAHLLGLGLSNAFNDKSAGGALFTGANATALYGDQVPLGDPGHFQNGLMFKGNTVLLDHTLAAGERRLMTELEFAALKDLGYDITLVSVPEATPVYMLLLITTLTVIYQCCRMRFCGIFRGISEPWERLRTQREEITGRKTLAPADST
jgi:hypothetical protein